MSTSAPTFLVTGGGGFIGTWVLRELLKRNFRVVVYDLDGGGERWNQLLGASQNDITLVRGDIVGAEWQRILDEHAITHVIHLAAWLTPMCQDDPVRGAEINIMGAMRLFQAMSERKGQIQGCSYASSFAIFGREYDDVSQSTAAIEADDPSQPMTFYGAFKRTDELIAHQYWLHHGIASVGLRPAVVYGPTRDGGLSAAPTLAARAAALDESFRFDFSGATRFEFVEDTALAFVRSALEVTEESHTSEIGGQVATVEELITILEELRPGAASLISIAGPPLPYVAAPPQMPIDRLLPDWKTTSLPAGLAQTVEFYRRSLSSSAST